MVSSILKLIRSLVIGFLIGSLINVVISISTKPVPLFTQSPELTPYIKLFKNRCKLYKVDCSRLDTLTIGIGDIMPVVRILSPNTIGTCHPTSNVVTLKKRYWERASLANRELLVFHELGHCVLDKDHDEENVSSIMYPSVMDERFYKLEYQNLMNELFDCSKDCPVVKFRRERYMEVHDGTISGTQKSIRLTEETKTRSQNQ